MKRKDRLVELIQSLSAAEKRYVRIFGERHLQKKDNKYLHLFDRLQVGEERGATQKNPASERNYLYMFILKAMRSFHEGKDIDIHLKETLINSRFLFEKRLYSHSLEMLSRAKEMAMRFERYGLLLDILFLESKIILERESKTPQTELADVHVQVKEVLSNLETDWPLIISQQQTFLLSRTRFHLQENERDKLLSIQHPNHETEDGRFTPQYYSLFARALYYHCLADYPQCLHIYEQLIQLWEEWPERKKEESIQYKKILSNYLTICHRLSRFDRFSEIIARIRSIPCRNQEEEAEQFQNLQLLELLYLMNTDGFDHLDHLAQETRAGLERYKTKINKARQLAFYYNFTVAYFTKHEWKTALNWLSLIIEDGKNEHRQDIQNFARVFRLVLWYETGKHELLEYEIINTERFLRKRKAWSFFESEVVKLLDKLTHVDQNELIPWLMKFRIRIDEHQKKGKNLYPIGFNELYYWACSYIENKPMRELVRSMPT